MTGAVYTPLLAVVVATGISAVVSALLFLGVRRAGHRSKLPELIERSVEVTVAGPVAAAIVGFSIIAVVNRFAIRLPFLGTAAVILVIELVMLAVAVRATGAVARNLMSHVTGHKEVDRVLVYGVYTLGLIALLFVLLTSPASPVVVAGIWQGVSFVTGLITTYLVIYVTNVVLKRYADILADKGPQLQTAVTFIRRIVLALIALVGVAAATFTSFPEAGATVASLFVAAGFTSIVVGLAAQSSLANIFAGVIISTAQPFRVGDALSVMNEWAWVEDIRLSYTILKTWDNRRLVIPNQLFLGQSLINYDLTDSSKLCIVYMQVQYESDLDLAIDIMKRAAREHPSFLPAGNLPVVHVMEYDQSGVQLRLLSNAKDQPTNFQMSKDLLYTIRKMFLAQGIRVAYPRREVVMTGGPPSGAGPGAAGEAPDQGGRTHD